ncbi:MAG: sulfurtransferase TusA family protein [Thalassospira sp.]|nr:sulfurtransferase TusA family protein [Thalassospira sp.]MDP2698169.1 sulfurtransferase TusA family protein [Thalassospira sp.]
MRFFVSILPDDPFDVLLDAQGMMCPMPVLKAKKALRDVRSGGILRVLATDPGSVADIKSFCEMTGNRLLASNQDDGVFTYDIEKA